MSDQIALALIGIIGTTIGVSLRLIHLITKVLNRNTEVLDRNTNALQSNVLAIHDLKTILLLRFEREGGANLDHYSGRNPENRNT